MFFTIWIKFDNYFINSILIVNKTDPVYTTFLQKFITKLVLFDILTPRYVYFLS